MNFIITIKINPHNCKQLIQGSNIFNDLCSYVQYKEMFTEEQFRHHYNEFDSDLARSPDCTAILPISTHHNLGTWVEIIWNSWVELELIWTRGLNLN